MKLTTLLGATAIAAAPLAGIAVAQELPPCENCAD